MLFRQSNAEETMVIVKTIRDKAISYLDPIKAKVPRAISERAVKKYQDMGVSLEWDLTDCESVFEFAVQSRSVEISPLERKAVELLRASSDVIRLGILTERGCDWLLSTYAQLDTPAIQKAEKFAPGRPKGSKSEITKYICELKRQYPDVQAKVLFAKADKEKLAGMPLKRFQNRLSECKKGRHE